VTQGTPAGLQELLRVLQAPAEPAEPALAEDLDEAERQLGIRLPADYREFAALFGSGSIGGFLHIRNPSSRNEYIRLVDAHEAQVGVLHELRDSGAEELPYPIHPEPGGLISGRTPVMETAVTGWQTLLTTLMHGPWP
jgi:hypothetical protein